MDSRVKVLIVEDDDNTSKALGKFLNKRGYGIDTARTGREAIKKVQSQFFNIVLLDIKLLDMEGTELLAPFKAKYPELEVIMITGHASLETAVRALNGGASAYITKPFRMDELLTKIKDVLEKQNQTLEIRRRLKALEQKIDDHKKAEEKLLYMASHDALTHLPNRALFKARLALEIARALRNQHKLAVMLLDLDYFKNVNDSIEHSVGDRILQLVGRRLKDLLRRSDFIARMGGDEFLVLIPEIAHEEEVTVITRKMLEAIRKPFVFSGHNLTITASIGIAIFSDDGKDPETLVRNADRAMYRAKRRGRNNYVFFNCF